MDNSRFLKKWLITATMAICIVLMFRLVAQAQFPTPYDDANPLYYLPIRNNILVSPSFLSMMGGFNPYLYSLLTGSTDITSTLELYPSIRMMGGFGQFAPSLNSGLAIRDLDTWTLRNYPFMGMTVDMMGGFNPLMYSGLLNTSTPVPYQESKEDSGANQIPEAEEDITYQEITEEQCSSGLAVEDPMSNCVNLSSPDFEDLEIVFCTKKAKYSSLDACIPISIVISNTGLDDIHLSEDQAEDIANDYIGVYGRTTRFMKVYLEQTAGPPIQQGVFLKPGESATLSAMLDSDRVALYTAPPLSGGIVTRTMDFQGPWGTLGLGRIDISIDIDFGVLPDSRVHDPGAGIDFVAGNLIIGFKEDVTLEDVEAFVDKYRCHIKYILELGALDAVIRIPFELTTGEVINAMLGDPDCSQLIKHIGRNYIGELIIWPPKPPKLIIWPPEIALPFEIDPNIQGILGSPSTF